MSADELIWLWNNLKPEPFGAMPLSNISGKTSVTSTKNYEPVASYNWIMEAYTDLENPNPTMVVPGAPKRMVFWNGGKLPLDEGYMIYDANHLRYPIGPMDPLFHAVRLVRAKGGKPELDFQQFDLVTDCINLQKIFTFCKGDEEGGLFRIDLERVGNTVIASRMEGTDVVVIDYDTFDQSLRNQCSKPLNSAVEGPFEQIVQYQFGQVHMLVRFEPDCAEYPQEGEAANSGSEVEAGEPAPDLEKRILLPESKYLRYIDHGAVPPKHGALYTMTSFPQSKGFPSFTWAHLFFSGIDKLAIGWWKGKDEFTKPAHYGFNEISKMIKPIPYATLSKVHDFLLKILSFMRKNEPDIRVALLWKGGEFMEIYEKSPTADGIIGEGIKTYLRGQVNQNGV